MIVQKHTHDYESGDRWFVTKDIIVIDDSGNEVLKLSLFGESFDQLKFKKPEEV